VAGRYTDDLEDMLDLYGRVDGDLGESAAAE
jgi:hypothetical protein